jgi:hypothetical protein
MRAALADAGVARSDVTQVSARRFDLSEPSSYRTTLSDDPPSTGQTQTHSSISTPLTRAADRWITARMRSGKHSITRGHGVVDARRVISSGSLRSQCRITDWSEAVAAPRISSAALGSLSGGLCGGPRQLGEVDTAAESGAAGSILWRLTNRITTRTTLAAIGSICRADGDGSSSPTLWENNEKSHSA